MVHGHGWTVWWYIHTQDKHVNVHTVQKENKKWMAPMLWAVSIKELELQHSDPPPPNLRVHVCPYGAACFRGQGHFPFPPNHFWVAQLQLTRPPCSSRQSLSGKPTGETLRWRRVDTFHYARVCALDCQGLSRWYSHCNLWLCQEWN